MRVKSTRRKGYQRDECKDEDKERGKRRRIKIQSEK
jgi:hypothetical protein